MGKKEYGFMAVAALVSVIVYQFLPPVPGLELRIIIVGAVATIAGAALGIRVAKIRPMVFWIVVLGLLVVFLLSFVLFLQIAEGEPGTRAAISLYVLAAFMFLPVGLLIEIAGLKIVEKST